MVIRYFGDSGRKKVAIITTKAINSPKMLANMIQSFPIFQKYITSRTGMDVSIMFKTVPLGTYHLIGSNSIRYRKPRAREPTQHIPKTNISPVVTSIEREKFIASMAANWTIIEPRKAFLRPYRSERRGTKRELEAQPRKKDIPMKAI